MIKLLKIAGWIVGGLLALFLIGVAIGGLQELFAKRRLTVLFDNGTIAAVTGRVDGAEHGTVPSHDLLRTDNRIPYGKHKVEILGPGGKVLETQDIDIEKTSVKERDFVYNIQQASHYAIYTIGYGSAKVKEPRRPLPDQKFFEVEYWVQQLGDGFPTTLRVRSGTGGHTYSVLGHLPIHRHRKCCEKLYKSLKT